MVEPKTPAEHPAAPARRVVRTVQGYPGSITVVCRGDRLTIRSVAPRDGWATAVERTDDIAAFSFHRRGVQTGFVVFASCVDGRAAFVSSPRGVSIDRRPIRQALRTWTFERIAQQFNWRPAFG